MPQLRLALTGVDTSDLEQLLRLVHRGELETPLTPPALALAGFQHRVEELMQSLRGLDEAGTRAVLVAVLAERREAARRS